jgi:hypothetical protein
MRQETAGQSPSEIGAELDEFLASSAGEKRVLVCTATANPGHIQYTWTVRNPSRRNDTPPTSAADSLPAAERTIVALGPSTAEQSAADGAITFNRSVLVLQDGLTVDVTDDGRADETTANGGADGVRTYVCTVNNTVGVDQCTIQVQGWYPSGSVTLGLPPPPPSFLFLTASE